MITLKEWLGQNYLDRGVRQSDAVFKMSQDLKASHSTVYLWLKRGDYYVDRCNETKKVSVYREIRAV